MEYRELKVYSGTLAACANCERPFQSGEVFTLADRGALAFCYSDGHGGCLQEYLFAKMDPPRMLMGEPKVFHRHTADAPVSRPPSAPTLGQRIKRLFSFGR